MPLIEKVNYETLFSEVFSLYQIYRRFSCVLIACIVLILGLLCFFQTTLPDTYYFSQSNDLQFPESYRPLLSFQNTRSSTSLVFSSETVPKKTEIDLFGLIPVKAAHIEPLNDKTVIVCGTPFGVKMFTDGVMIVSLSPIPTSEGMLCPAANAGIQEGDVIHSIDGQTVFTNEDVAATIQSSDGQSLSFSLERDGKPLSVTIIPEKASDGSGYKVGFWVRDSSAGIGTMTFCDPEIGIFAGLGHAICDTDTGNVLPLLNGDVVPAIISSVKKGKSGKPGELVGNFFMVETIGILKINNETGVYGTLLAEPQGSSVPIAPKQTIREGEATILSTISGSEAKEYTIQIEKVSLAEKSPTKNMVIRVTDPELLEQTGGIIQGMSGSPILQNGKLVGAVTHVFVNNPTKGYAIFAENMWQTASSLF